MLENPREEERGEELEPEFRPPSRRNSWIALALVALAAAAGVGLFLLYRKTPPSPAAPAREAAAPSPLAREAAAPPPVLDAARIRTLLEAISPDPMFRAWLADGDVIRRWAVITDNLAEGVSPRKQLGAFSLGRPFSVARHGRSAVIAPEAYARFDPFAQAVASADPKAFAAAYRELHPALEAAYRGLGYPNAAFDRATAKALRRIEGVPAPAGEVEVEGDGPYAFADPRLERLGPAEKQLLRMGPANLGRIQAKAREIREALGL